MWEIRGLVDTRWDLWGCGSEVEEDLSRAETSGTVMKCEDYSYNMIERKYNLEHLRPCNNGNLTWNSSISVLQE